MTTEKQTIKYLGDLKADYDRIRALNVSFMEQFPGNSRAYALKIAAVDGAIEALDFIAYYITTGKEHPTLAPEEVKTEAADVEA